jgi:Na+/proline symporter
VAASSRGRGEEQSLSDIGLNFSPAAWAAIALFIGWPGLLVGAIAGALLWRRRRIAGAVLGAVIGFAAVLGAFYLWKMSELG